MAAYWDKCIYCSAFAELQQIDDVLTTRSFSDEDSEVEIDILDPAWNGEEQIEVGELFDHVAGFIASLPPREQEIVHRIFWLRETQASVARSLGVSRMAICKTLMKVAKFGRGHFADLYDDALLYDGALVH